MSNRIRVLYVDDDVSSLEIRGDILEEEAGFEIFTAETATEAEDILARESIECVLSDYHMPGKDGLDLLAHVREEYNNLPFILFTSHESEDLAREAFERGATDFFPKSVSRISYDLLAERINHAVAQYRLVDQIAQLLRHLPFTDFTADDELPEDIQGAVISSVDELLEKDIDPVDALSSVPALDDTTDTDALTEIFEKTDIGSKTQDASTRDAFGDDTSTTTEEILPAVRAALLEYFERIGTEDSQPADEPEETLEVDLSEAILTESLDLNEQVDSVHDQIEELLRNAILEYFGVTSDLDQPERTSTAEEAESGGQPDTGADQHADAQAVGDALLDELASAFDTPHKSDADATEDSVTAGVKHEQDTTERGPERAPVDELLAKSRRPKRTPIADLLDEDTETTHHRKRPRIPTKSADPWGDDRHTPGTAQVEYYDDGVAARAGAAVSTGDSEHVESEVITPPPEKDEKPGIRELLHERERREEYGERPGGPSEISVNVESEARSIAEGPQSHTEAIEPHPTGDADSSEQSDEATQQASPLHTSGANGNGHPEHFSDLTREELIAIVRRLVSMEETPQKQIQEAPTASGEESEPTVSEVPQQTSEPTEKEPSPPESATESETDDSVEPEETPKRKKSQQSGGATRGDWADAPNYKRPDDLDLAPGRSVLVQCNSQDHRRFSACADLLHAEEAAGANLVIVRYSEMDAQRLMRIAEHVGDIKMITVGYHQRVPREFEDQVETLQINNPNDLTRLGIVVSGIIEKWSDDETVTYFCLDPIDVVLQYVSAQNAFRFLHILIGKLQQAGAIAHIHVDPTATEPQQVNVFKPLFDEVMTIDAGGTSLE